MCLFFRAFPRSRAHPRLFIRTRAVMLLSPVRIYTGRGLQGGGASCRGGKTRIELILFCGDTRHPPTRGWFGAPRFGADFFILDFRLPLFSLRLILFRTRLYIINLGWGSNFSKFFYSLEQSARKQVFDNKLSFFVCFLRNFKKIFAIVAADE